MSTAKKTGLILILLTLMGTPLLYAQSDPFKFDIGEVTDADIGDTILITIDKTAGTTTPIDGFDMLITFNPEQLVPLYAEPGALIEGGVFEYFDYRHGYMVDHGDSIYTERIVGMLEDGQEPVNTNQPVTANGELIRLYFVVINPNPCANSPINFLWFDCGDNVVRVPDFPPGDSVSGYVISRFVYDFAGNTLTNTDGIVPTLGGFPDTCFGYVAFDPVLRYADFQGGKVETAGCGQISDRGDLNLNGVPYEIADAVVYTSYLMIGLPAFTIDIERQVAATDINGDGLTLTMADFIYLIRVIEGELLPLPDKGLGDITGNIYISDTDSSLLISTDFDGGIGGLFMNFSLAGVTGHSVDILDGADHMNYIDNDDGGSLKMLLYKIRTSGDPSSAVIGSGYQLVAEVFYEGDAPTLTAVTPVGFLAEQVDYNVIYTSFPNQPPHFEEYPSVLYNDSANIFFYDFNAIDPDGDPVSYRLIDGVGSLDTLTGVYYFGPVCCQLDSILNIEICAEDEIHLCPQSDPSLHAHVALVVNNPSPFLGDMDNDRDIDIFDIMNLIAYKFKGGPAPYPLENGDVNFDGTINILDIITLIRFKYMGAPAPTCQN